VLLIDKIAYSSKLKDKDPLLKSFFAVTALIICVASKSFFVSFAVILIMGSLTVIKGRTPLKYYIKLYSIPMIFLFMSTLAILINIELAPIEETTIPIFHFYLGNLYFSVEADGLIAAMHLILTALGAVSCLYFLSLTTPVTELLYVLERLRCPYLFIELLMLIYRFIFILYDMAGAISISQKSRLVNRNFKTALQGISGLWVILFIHSLRKSSILYDAMEARCYDGNLRFLQKTVKVSQGEMAGTLLILLFLLLTAYFSPV
jgi:cobalt/nickel transport system permease protein